jgi:hypothetical protein
MAYDTMILSFPERRRRREGERGISCSSMTMCSQTMALKSKMRRRKMP